MIIFIFVIIQKTSIGY